jgi:hypothetical protein
MNARRFPSGDQIGEKLAAAPKLARVRRVPAASEM